jgi:hypothetical protein
MAEVAVAVDLVAVATSDPRPRDVPLVDQSGIRSPALRTDSTITRFLRMKG